MAFKFKVKKRPSMGQAVASAFAAGAIQGGTTALQNAMKEREDRKNNSTKELNSFNSVIAGLPSTPDNLSKIIPIKSKIATGEITARNGLDILGVDLDYQTTQQKQADIKLRQEEFSNLSSDSDIVAKERETMQKIEMGGLKPTENVINVRKKEAEIRRGVKTDPTTEKKYRAYNKTTGELMQATESEVEGNPNIAFGTPQQPATKKVLNKATGEEQFATEAQIANAKGNLVPTKSQPAFLALFDEIPETISPSLPTSVSLGKAMSNEVKLSPGTVINDSTLGKLTFTGGDQADLENYRIDAK
jgi:hypothetical protein